ncbi:enoyl-CoA hydratase/isomerase family protein [Bordetella trematum]|uniref:enoyl-CoA hydratase/isomerase family protein n=1 Tax=Bordetella trematum TaxID=123899 RepID=UPI003AF385D9
MSDPTCGVLLEHDGPIARLTLDRPASRNSLDLPLALALRDAVRSLEGDAAPRVLILRSSNAHFMAGGDVRRFDALLQDSPAACQAELARIIGAANDTVARLTRLPCPVIGLVGGSAAGFGLSLALACDLTLAAEDARFLFAYGAIGATPDGGASWHLPRRIGLQRALAMALLNTSLDAAQALAAGLVCQVVPAAELDAAGQRLAGGNWPPARARRRPASNACCARPWTAIWTPPSTPKRQAFWRKPRAPILPKAYAPSANAGPRASTRPRPEFHPRYPSGGLRTQAACTQVLPRRPSGRPQ